MPAFVWIIALPLLASPVIYLAGRATRGEPNHAARWTALLAMLLTWVPLVLAAQDLARGGVATFAAESIALRFDGLALIVAVVALALGTLVTWFSGPYMASETGEEKYYAMLAAMIGAIVGLGCAADLFNLWLWFEAMAVSSYLLVAFYRDHKASLEAGVKYLVQSATGSVLVLIGIALVFAQTGAVTLDGVHQYARMIPAMSVAFANYGLLAAGALFIVGFGVKAALVPLHTWLPDAHAEAPSGISAMLSGVVIEAGLVALLRIITALAPVSGSWGDILIGMGALNMVVGNLLALRQKQVKRLLAFSSVAQVGYMLLGIGITVSTGQPAGAQGGLFHFFNHGLMKGLAFLAAGAMLYALYIARGEHRPLAIADLAGAAQRYPLPAAALSIAVLGLGGLPPLAGFMSKWQIFVAGFQTNNGVIEAFVIFAALNSVLSLAYYAPLVNAVYRLEPSPAVQNGRPISIALGAPLVLLSAAVIIIGVYPSILDWLTAPAGRAILTAMGG